MLHSRSRLLPLLASAACLLACQSKPAPSAKPLVPVKSAPSEAATPIAAAPIEAANTDADSVWEYLLDKYDVDGDGAVGADEYEREGGRFDRLDSDGDGQLSAADFSSGGRSNDGRMREVRAYVIVASYFQDDDDALQLSMSEVGASFGAYDGDGDGTIAREEFELLMAERWRDVSTEYSSVFKVDDTRAFELLAAALDEDEDALLSDNELITFFESRDEDGDSTWIFEPAEERTAAIPEESSSGAMSGDIAPDFTLESPDGKSVATLSSFRGDKPVALIFGSYT
jgi:hypothetical protein